MDYGVFRNNAAYYSPGERFNVLHPLAFVASPLSTLLFARAIIIAVCFEITRRDQHCLLSRGPSLLLVSYFAGRLCTTNGPIMERSCMGVLLSGSMTLDAVVYIRCGVLGR